MQNPEFATLVRRDWKTVLRYPTHVAVLKEHCVICSQWCAAIKQHVRLMHPNAWDLKTDAEDRCRSSFRLTARANAVRRRTSSRVDTLRTAAFFTSRPACKPAHSGP